jgi:hypothetical protein
MQARRRGRAPAASTPLRPPHPLPLGQGSGYLLRRGSTVFNSTARQLGLIRTPGIPSLVVSEAAAARRGALPRPSPGPRPAFGRGPAQGRGHAGITHRNGTQAWARAACPRSPRPRTLCAQPDPSAPLPKPPSLPPQDHLLPRSAPPQCRRAARQLLMLPPPPEQAAHIHAAVTLLAGAREGLEGGWEGGRVGGGRVCGDAAHGSRGGEGWGGVGSGGRR